jgi:hypothetical protein
MFMRWNVGNKKGISQNAATALSQSKPKLVQTMREEKKETIIENLDSFFYNANANSNAYYLPTVGVTNLKLCEPNEVIADQATIFFRILDAFRIPYALFAGSSIGLLRNGKTLPFVDDYDVIILNQHVPLLTNAAPVLKKHGFKIIQNVNPQTKQKTNGGCSIYSYVLQKYYNNDNDDNNDDDNDDDDNDDDDNNDDDGGYEGGTSVKKSYFHCDLFFSYFDGGGFLRNNASWGLYHGKNIHMKDVLPFQRRAFDGLYLPFFKNVESEVYKCYGDIELCIVKSHSMSVQAVYRSWKTAHAEFERIKQCAKDNTMKAILQNQYNNQNENSCEEGNGKEEDGKEEDGKEEDGKEEVDSRKETNSKNALNILDNVFSNNSLYVLRNIHENKVKTIYSFSMEFIIRHAACIKYYFPTIQIEYFSYSRDIQVIMFLNYVDALHVYNAAIRDFYNDPQIIYLKKPRIDLITVITFGAFSRGGGSKDFSILTKCAKYSENICVGLLTGVGAAQAEPVESRMNSVKRCCKLVKGVWSGDDSAEFKNRCAETCGANIVVTVTGEEREGLESRCCVIRIGSNDVNLKKTKSVHF